MATQSVRLAVDTGGTFTSVMLDVEGQTFAAKTLTPCSKPEDAVIEAMRTVCAEAGIIPNEITQIIHGTTLATNTLRARRGAKTAFITTQVYPETTDGQRDQQGQIISPNPPLPEQLLSRDAWFTIPLRTVDASDASFSLIRADVEAVVSQLSVVGFECVAVGLCPSHHSAAQEMFVAQVLAEMMPDAWVSLSCKMPLQPRASKRFSKVVANAIIAPVMTAYLAGLETQLRAEGVACDVLLMSADGGLMSFDEGMASPVRLVAASNDSGVAFAKDIAARYGVEKVISFEMGGVSSKISLIDNGPSKTRSPSGEIGAPRHTEGWDVRPKLPDVVEIAVGGGSLASLDAARDICVAADTAGLVLGPACYGRGGGKPAVSDANLVVDRMRETYVAGGTIELDHTAALTAIQTVVGKPLDIQTRTAAFRIVEAVDQILARAGVALATATGADLTGYTMIAFGGAGPQHAGRLCENLGVTRCLVPPDAGIGSAIGLLRAPFSHRAYCHAQMSLSAFEVGETKDLFAQLRAKATSFLRKCNASSPILFEFTAQMHVSGEDREIAVTLTEAQALSPDAAILRRLFLGVYEKLFGDSFGDAEILIVALSVNAMTQEQQVARSAQVQPPLKTAVINGKCRIYDPGVGTSLSSYRYDRDRFKVGRLVRGAAQIAEANTTTIVPKSRVAICQPDGCIDIVVPSENTRIAPSKY
ncbi:hydantoinase/oxoprolinase family protein [uncultured Sulfitobacter sp.]|uniref:hydantoinase/oxoprolinase family protein n=1 Tax=uncultured Sulfitobacter sp. TaxID=191468 RepID=UPI00262310CB|nr:hydantoinase/oxoprolinase family protein [uncultured Sulfitobacter sp.]